MVIDNKNFKSHIQILRGIAVSIVVLYHLQIPGFSNGYLGVDVFFVISGFLMAKLYDRDSILSFYKRRLDRLLCPALFVIFLTIAISFFITVPTDFNQIKLQSIFSSLFLVNIIFWSQDNYFDYVAFKPLLNYWSLALEVQYYILVPFLYPIIRRSKKNFYLVFFASIFSCFIMTFISPKTSFFWMPFRIWEFLIGAYIVFFTKTNTVEFPGLGAAVIKKLVPVLLLLIVVIAATTEPSRKGFYALLFGHPGVYSFIVSLLTLMILKYEFPDFLARSFLGRSLIYLGTISYSIYLVHFPVVVLYNYMPFGGTILQADTIQDVSIVLILTLLISHFVYKKIEPIKIISKFGFRVIFISFVLVAIFQVASSYLISMRYDQYQNNIFNAFYDRDTHRCGILFKISNPTSQLCLINENLGGEPVLLLGNSHADSIKKVFATVASEYGNAVFFSVDNKPLMYSKQSFEDVLGYIAENRIHKIVIHYSNIYSDVYFKEQLLNFVDHAAKQNLKVSLIAPVPYYDVHVPMEMYLNHELPESVKLNKLKYFSKIKDFHSLINVLQSKNVNIYYPHEFLCNLNEPCKYKDLNGRPFYYDTAHLTITGSEQLSVLFETILKDMSGN